MKKEQLIQFENEIASTFNRGGIRAPIYLYSNNENFLIKFFKKVNLRDLVDRMKKEEKKEKKNSLILSAAAVSAVAVFGIILTL